MRVFTGNSRDHLLRGRSSPPLKVSLKSFALRRGLQRGIQRGILRVINHSVHMRGSFIESKRESFTENLRDKEAISGGI